MIKAVERMYSGVTHMCMYAPTISNFLRKVVPSAGSN